MKFKITNINRFITSIAVAAGIIICIVFMFPKASFSTGELSYKKITVCSGDTLWGIASNESITNSYYKNKDIRMIIDQIKSLNNLTNSSLDIGQELLIYEL